MGNLRWFADRAPPTAPAAEPGIKRGEIVAWKLRLLAALGFAVVAVWLYASPYITVYQMKRAIEQKDAAGFSAHVNYPALRENLKGTLGAMVTREMAKQQGNPLAVLGVALATPVVNNLVEAMVTPEAVGAMMQGEIPNLPGQTPGAKPASNADVSLAYESFDRFVATVRTKEKPEDPLGLIFLRDGLSWKLSALRLPGL